MVHHYPRSIRYCLCDGIRRNSEYPDGRCAAYSILPAGYLCVGLFLQLPERNVELIREQCGYLRQGLFPPYNHAACGGDDEYAEFCHPVGDFHCILYLLCSNGYGARDPLADCALPRADRAAGADGGGFRNDLLVHDDQIQRFADHAGENHLAMGLYHPGDLSVEHGDEREVALGDESESRDACDGGDQVLPARSRPVQLVMARLQRRLYGGIINLWPYAL